MRISREPAGLHLPPETSKAPDISMTCNHKFLVATRTENGKVTYHCKKCGEVVLRDTTTVEGSESPSDFRFALALQALKAAEEAERNKPVISAEGTTREMFIGFIMKSMERFFLGFDTEAKREIAQEMLKDFLESEKIKFADPSQVWDAALAEVIVDEMTEHYCEGASNS